MKNELYSDILVYKIFDQNAPKANKAMRKLKPEYQQVLWLIYFEDLSNKETAKIMKKSVRNIETLVSRARKSLKSQLEMEGFEYEKL